MIFTACLLSGRNVRLYANQRNQGIRFKPQTLEALQYAFILICHCEIYRFYVPFYLPDKANVLEAFVLYVTIFFDIFLLTP